MYSYIFFRVTDIKYNSPAHTSGKIEDGDEIVQINYQTVVGWQYQKVIVQLQESPPDILITLKKRPKHTKIYGQIYMKPYRLPSKKKSSPYRWGESMPSPRTELLPIQDFPMPLTRVSEKQHASSDSDDNSDIMTPNNPKASNKDLRLYLPKPRAVLQRRNTICGDRTAGFKSNVMFWHERKNCENSEDSPSLRDKCVSFGFGLEITQRPTTCLGIGNSTGKYSDFSGLKGSLPEILTESVQDGCGATSLDGEVTASKPGISKVVRFDANRKIEEYKDTKYTCNVENTILEVFEPIPYVDEDEIVPEKISDDLQLESLPVNQEPLSHGAVNDVLVNTKRGRLDKSHSTPVYDDDSEDDSGKCIVYI